MRASGTNALACAVMIRLAMLQVGIPSIAVRKPSTLDKKAEKSLESSLFPLHTL